MLNMHSDGQPDSKMSIKSLYSINHVSAWYNVTNLQHQRSVNLHLCDTKITILVLEIIKSLHARQSTFLSYGRLS